MGVHLFEQAQVTMGLEACYQRSQDKGNGVTIAHSLPYLQTRQKEGGLKNDTTTMLKLEFQNGHTHTHAHTFLFTCAHVLNPCVPDCHVPGVPLQTFNLQVSKREPFHPFTQPHKNTSLGKNLFP